MSRENELVLLCNDKNEFCTRQSQRDCKKGKKVWREIDSTEKKETRQHRHVLGKFSRNAMQPWIRPVDSIQYQFETLKSQPWSKGKRERALNMHKIDGEASLMIQLFHLLT